MQTLNSFPFKIKISISVLIHNVLFTLLLQLLKQI